MKRLLPQSLLGQVMLVLALGLLVAQAISAVLLYRAAEQRRDASVVNSIGFRLIAEQATRDGRAAGARERRGRRRRAFNLRELEPPGPPPDRSRPFARLVRLSLQRSAMSPIGQDERRFKRYESALADLLDQQEIATTQIVVTRRMAGDDPHIRAIIEEAPRLPLQDWEERRVLVASIEQPGDGGWLTVRIPDPRRQIEGPAMIVLQTLVIFVVLVSLLYLVLRRITRPLAELTARVGDFSRQPDRVVKLIESGPSDTRRLIAAHNAMEARVAALLDEKDVMLGAIGHDLKTPLAALRVRIESVPDETQRERMAMSIEDITATLDDILSLARVGRSGALSEAVELGALAISVVEEFEDLGEPVTINDPPRLVAQVQVTWLKRALRNLIANAVRYGGNAEITVLQAGGQAILRVEDDGPGVPADQIEAMLEPFARGEASRNRATGGAGLGLTLARAIAEQHGGSLALENRAEGGLRAELCVPL
ncbi:MAG: ATP-binding protein [Pseudomonadota bacterium]